MKQILILMFIVSCYTAYAQEKTPVALHGQLSVANGKIVDHHNQAAPLRGVSMFWSIWEGQQYYNPEVINWLRKDFKISLLRLAMGIEPKGGFLSNPIQQKELVISSVDAAIKNGLYVVIDWHDHHAHQHQDKAIAFFSEMAKRYAGKENVIYEIYNEPLQIDWQIIKSYAVDVIKAIRIYDKENIIIVGSPSWDQDVDVAAKDPITGFKNIAYSFHFYASDPNHQERLRKKADIAIAAGLPLFITEWGVGESNGNGIFDIRKTDKWIKWMEDNKLSWANWSLVDKKETTAILSNGAPVNGGWTTGQLSPGGQYIRNKLRTLNEAIN
ncbi:MAG: glycoside hydrolase family 5 protein [Sphingobacteriaceae bacterium]